MKRILALALVCLVLVLVPASVLATTATNNLWLKNPFLRIWNAIHQLQSRLSNITLLPGPQGPPGPPGPAGPSGECGAACNASLLMLPDCIEAADCYDNNICTDDACDSITGCTYTYNNSPCDDGNPDTLNDVCSNGLCNGQNSGGGTGTATGSLVITEVMYNPDVVTDTYGEWVELYNPGNESVNLNGWSIKDYGSDDFTCSQDVFVPSRGYAVLCKNDNITLNGGIVCDAQYASFTLGNTNDAIILTDISNKIVDEVQYNLSIEPWKSLNKAGYTLQLDPAYYDSTWNDDGLNWCNAYEPLSGGDWGTPGWVNSDCNTG